MKKKKGKAAPGSSADPPYEQLQDRNGRETRFAETGFNSGQKSPSDDSIGINLNAFYEERNPAKRGFRNRPN